VAITRALAVDPAVLLLDEPDAALDAAAAALEQVIAELGADRLVVFSTHDGARAERLAGSVVTALQRAYSGFHPVIFYGG
jgi:ABC-type sulfate/molybdate transport systems ATPase subunit